VCEIVFRCTEIICFDGIVAFRCTKLICFEEILVAKILLIPYILSVVPYIYFCSIKIVLEYDYIMGVWVYGCTGVWVYGCTITPIHLYTHKPIHPYTG
jgi:hypothetical protein